MNEGTVSPRVVSLIASATEIACALGFQSNLVGRSHECDFPPSIRRLPVCTEPSFETEGSSAEVDRRVKDILRKALSVYRVDEAMLAELCPDVIVTQSQCEVCAVSLSDVETAIGEWIESRPHIVSLEPNALEDVWRDIDAVAAALGAPERGTQLIDALRGRMSTIASRVEQSERRLSVACIEWIDPLMAAGNWVPELIAMAGGRNLFGEAGKHSPWMTFEELIAADPEVILVMPCGYDISKSRFEMTALTKHSKWRQLKAVQSDRIFLTDGNQYFNRPGPRLADSLEIVAEILYPDTFHFGHDGTGWLRFSSAED